METTDLLGLGDAVPPPPVSMKRDRDSVDDFEQFDQAERALEAELLPSAAPPPQPPRLAADFLDTERDIINFSDQPAEKLSDSDEEPERSVGSPQRAAPPVPPHAPGAFDAFSAPLPESPAVLAPQRVSPPPPAREPSPPPVPRRDPSPPPPAYPPRPVLPPPAPPAKIETRQPTAHVIEAEVIFCQMGLDAWFNPERLHPKVESLIYWRDPVKSGAALGAGLALLVALACCSVVSVLAYVSLIALTGTVAFRIYKNILQAVQKTSEGHPFKWLLDVDISLPAERTQQIAAAATAHANAFANELRRLFLVEDLIDSLRFGVILWSLTYVGAWFNGITLIILSYVALFTLPKAYEANKAQVDANLELARAKINDITNKVRAAVPLGKKESDKDK